MLSRSKFQTVIQGEKVSKFWFLTVSFPEGSRSSLICSWHSDWATELTVRGSGPDRGNRFLSSPKRSDRLWGPSSLPTNGYRDSFPGIKRPESEVHHSPSSRAESENEWSYYLYSSRHKRFYFTILLLKLSCDQWLLTKLFVWPVHYSIFETLVLSSSHWMSYKKNC